MDRWIVSRIERQPSTVFTESLSKKSHKSARKISRRTIRQQPLFEKRLSSLRVVLSLASEHAGFIETSLPFSFPWTSSSLSSASPSAPSLVYKANDYLLNIVVFLLFHLLFLRLLHYFLRLFFSLLHEIFSCARCVRVCVCMCVCVRVHIWTALYSLDYRLTFTVLLFFFFLFLQR